MSPFKRLVESLSAEVEAGGSWSLTISRLAELIETDETDLYALIYRQSHARTARPSVAGRTYSPDNVGELIQLLEVLFPEKEETAAGKPVVEAAFTRPGLFVPYHLRVELQERLVRQFIADYILHPADLSTFDSMLRATRRADRAVDLYLDEYFPLEPAIRRAADNFTRDGDYPPPMAATAANYLRTLFSRHLLDRHDLLAPLVRLLRGRARDTGYLPAGSSGRRAERRSEERGPDDVAAGAGDGELERARSLFGLRDRETNPTVIRERYKSLIRRYHPDVNPAGLEMSKQINVSYALLLAHAAR